MKLIRRGCVAVAPEYVMGLVLKRDLGAWQAEVILLRGERVWIDLERSEFSAAHEAFTELVNEIERARGHEALLDEIERADS